MERILEPEYMDTVEEATSYEAMDHTTANRNVVDAFLQAGGSDATHVLDIGTGPGDVLLLLADALPTAKIQGLDAAETMLALAQKKLEAAKRTARVSLQVGDAKALPFDSGSFDGVVSNTILHHIPDPIPYLREAGRVLAPEGSTLLIRDLYRPADRDSAQRLVDLHASEADATQQRLFLDSLCAALTLDEAREAVRTAGLDGATVEMTSDRHYTIRWSR